ncbi:MAG: exodeoxyribonuclease VII small subunit [Alphaproteobacteria bacterium]|uniref:Exodeoxyribonuclease VII small subunit n=1 Tax=Candidatus Nitrobium versatile TaxID=2884831 RepID=A0A953M2W7_9BACT|nr:exodeoxyribonuclease VII small subunit [Candidatus Nitrobium versatile]
MGKSRQITYRQALTELEQIVGEIEAEDIDVDILAEKVRRATFLITFCRGRLRNAEDEVKKALSGPPEQPEERTEQQEPGGLF